MSKLSKDLRNRLETAISSKRYLWFLLDDDLDKVHLLGASLIAESSDEVLMRELRDVIASERISGITRDILADYKTLMGECLADLEIEEWLDG